MDPTKAATAGSNPKALLKAPVLGRLFAAPIILKKSVGWVKKTIGQNKGDPMKTKSLKMAIKSILIVAIVGFALIALTGCGIGHGPYRHGYDGQNYYNNADYDRSSGYGYSGNPSTRGYGSMMGYGPVRSGDCSR